MVRAICPVSFREAPFDTLILSVKKYILIAGVNGAGKSTLYQLLQSLHDIPRVNTDEILREFGDWRNMTDVMNAGKMAVKKIARYFDEGITFNQETTLCGKSILSNIAKAKKRGYFIELHYIGVENADIAKERVAKRVKQGGHGITERQTLLRNIPFCSLGEVGGGGGRATAKPTDSRRSSADSFAVRMERADLKF